jgi:glycine/D-amino acid oxidase-like deaminating enzyme
MAANSPDHYEGMARELELKRKHLGDESEMVPRSRQHREIGSDAYHGGAVIAALAALHPGLYQLGLLERAREAGARVFDYCPVSSITRRDDGFTVATPEGTTKARDVVIATNGYTGTATPWHRRRLVAFRGFMMASEELPAETLDRILPNGRTTHDYNNNLVFMRRAPDSPRLMFGGLTGTMSDDMPAMASRLHAKMRGIFPDLEHVRISRMWNGYCAGSFDLFPHMGVHDGMHYALGYNFAGVPMGTYLGGKIAKRILGEPDWSTVFTDRPFPRRWWHRGGTPWFLPFYMAHLNRLDRLGR